MAPKPKKVRKPKRVQARHASGYRAVFRGTPWGNPFPVNKSDPSTRERSIRKYEKWLYEQLRRDPDFLEPLRGYNLGCFCSLDLPCHADVILRRLYG